MFYLILLLVILPLFMSLIHFLPVFKNYTLARNTSVIFSILYFIYSLSFLSYPCLSLSKYFYLDNLSLLMIILTSFSFLVSIISFELCNHKKYHYFYTLSFLLESIIIGLFLTKDLFIFFTLWELELTPMYFLIRQWGNEYSKRSALKFVLYTFCGSLFILLGFILIYLANSSLNGYLSFDINCINIRNINILIQLFISLCLFIGFGVKIPIFPLHNWLNYVHSNSATPVSIILASVLLKLGIYGLIRFNFYIVTYGFAILAKMVGLLALINIIYGACLAYKQNDIKRVIACSSISQMGIIVLGLCSLTKPGYIAAIFHSVSHALIVSGLFFIVGVIKNKFGTTSMNCLHNLAESMPRLYNYFIVLALASIGVPFLAGFVGEFLTIYGCIISNILVFKLYGIIAISVILLSALYMTKLIYKIFFNESDKNCVCVEDIKNYQTRLLSLIVGLVIILGCFPMLLINMFN